jgi:hypothetical protein
MAENIFKDLLPEEDRGFEDKPKSNNMFSDLLSEEERDEPIKNEFKFSDTPDEKYQLNESGLFQDLLPEEEQDKSLTKLYTNPDTEFGVGDAFLLGLTDTFRGVTQFFGGEKVFLMDDDLKTQQAKLNAALQGEGGGLIAAAYFGGAILDPVTWLIPVLRGRKLYQMAMTGGVSGGLAGALGYVDENSLLFDERYKQAAAGALGGAILSPAIGKTLEAAGIRKVNKLLEGQRPKDEDVAKLPDNLKRAIPLAGEEPIFKGTRKTLEKSKRKGKIKGRGKVEAIVREKIKFKQIDRLDGRPGKDTNRDYILRGPREFFKTILGSYVKPVVEPIAKPIQAVTKPIAEGTEKIKGAYTKKAQKIYDDYFSVGPKAGEFGTGAAGALYGFALPDDDKLFGVELPEELQGGVTEKFSRAALGFMMGYGGIKLAKKTQVPDFIKESRRQKLGLDDVEQDLSVASFLAKAFVDGYKVPKVVKELETKSLEGLRNKIELSFLRIYQQANQLTTDERKVLYNLLEGDIKYNDVPKDLAQLAKKARNQITKITQMYIDAGLISEETALRNIERYVKRTYGGKETSKIGSELRARGVLEKITPRDWVNSFSKNKAFRLNNEGKLVRLQGHKGWELFGNVDKVKGVDKVGGESEKATPQLVKKLANDPKKANKDILTVRWEYTKQERLGMSEIEDGAFAIMETGRLMAQTLPRYKFYGDLAAQTFTKTSPSADEINRLDLVLVPDSTRAGTIQKTYGKLAGKYIPREVFENIFQINKIAEGPSSTFGKGYRALNQVWKASKTAWNPTVHVNNMVSNLVLLDLVDGSASFLPAAVTAFKNQSAGKSVKVLEEASNLGVFSSNYVKQELKGGILDPDNIKPAYYNVDPNKDVFENGVNLADFIYKDLIVKNKLGLAKLSEYYGLEDSIFRLALYMDRRKKGYSKVRAAQDARKSFIDYNIQAPGINGLRNLPTPFLAYTYRVVPILAETAVVRPWKYAKYAVLGYGLNNLGELLGEGSPEAERAAMTEEQKGKVGGLPFLPHKNIKIPTTDASRYVNVTRFVPGGDIFDLNSGTIPLVPQPLQANFGIAGEVLFPMLGFDLFRGDKIKGQGVSEFDDFSVRANFALKKLIPNFPFVPGSYSTERIRKAREDKSPLRRDETEFMAFLNTLGFKINKTDVGRLRTIKGFEFRRKVKGIQEKIRIEANKVASGKITELEYNKRVNELNEQYDKIRNKFIQDVNVPIDYQEGVPLSEMIPTVTSALKEQTQELFGKN